MPFTVPDDNAGGESGDLFEIGGAITKRLTEGVGEFAAGAALGVSDDPFIRRGLQEVLGQDVTEEIQGNLRAAAGDGIAGGVGELAGTVLPALAGGIGGFVGGTKLATAGAARAGAAGLLGKQGATLAARNLPGAGAKVAAGEFLPAINTLEKTVRALGGSVGFGAYEGARELAAGAELEEAAKSAAIATGIALAFEGAIIGAGSLAGASRARLSEINKKPIQEQLGVFTKKLSKLDDEIGKALKRNDQALSLARERVASDKFLKRLEPGKKSPPGADAVRKAMAERARDLGRLAKAQERSEKFLNQTLPEKLRKEKQLVVDRTALEDALASGDHFLNTSKGRVYNPDGPRLEVSKFALRFTSTPEGLMGKLGGVANRLMFKPLAEADQAASLAREHNEFLVKAWFDRTKKNMGLRRRDIHRDRKLFTALVDAFETGSDDGVRAYMRGIGRTAQQADDQVRVFQEWRETSRRIAQTLEDMGAQPLMTVDDLAKNGLVEHFPHVIADRSEAEIRRALTKRLGAAEADRIVVSITEPGIAKWGSFDFNRVLRGSLKSKIDDPDITTLYESNPFIAMLDYMNRGRYRIEYGNRFGLNGELKEPILNAIRKDAGNGASTLASNILDQAMGRKYTNEYWRQWANIAVNYQIATKLGMAVFPNLSQSANTVAFTGLRNTLKALIGVMKPHERRHVEQALGFYQGLQTHITQAGSKKFTAGAASGNIGRLDRASDAMDNLAYNVLHGSQFTRVEAWNRFVGGGAGRFAFRDDLRRMSQGRLRGVSFDAAQRRMNSLGISPDELKTLVRGVKENGGSFLDDGIGRVLEDRAIYRAAQITQFTPGSLRRPDFWNHPVGRAIFQFKSFALNQGRFMKDQVLAEAAAGNMKPLAHVLSIYPVAGEIVGDVKALAKMKDRDKHGVDRVVENFMSVGGIGILSDLYQSAKWGGLLDSIAGPTISDATGMLERIAQEDAQGLLRDFARQPTMQAGRTAVTVGAAAAFEAADRLEEPVRNIGELLFQERQKNQ